MNKIKEKLQNDVIDFLSNWSDDKRRENWKVGASLSYTLIILREKGWKNLGNICDFESLMEELGFTIIPGKLKNGKNHPSIKVISL